MKLVYPDYSYQIKFIEGKVNVVVIENASEFRHLIQELLIQIDGNDGRFVLSNDEEILKISSNIQCIIDPFSLELNNKKILDKIYTSCRQEILDSDLFLQQVQLFSDIKRFVENVIGKIDYSLCYTEEIDIKSILKLVNLKLIDENSGFLEKIVDYIKLNHTLLGNKIFFFIGLRSFLSENELGLLYKMACYNKIFLVLVEAHDFDNKSDYEKKYIIDKDCCEIYWGVWKNMR